MDDISAHQSARQLPALEDTSTASLRSMGGLIETTTTATHLPQLDRVSCHPLKRANDWSDCTIRMEGRYFKDQYNRVTLLRGVNCCGNSKLPTTFGPGAHSPSQNKPALDPATNLPLPAAPGIFRRQDMAHVSFLGRPFVEADVMQHLTRLRAWGLSLLRILIPWEALEHDGPGLYDEAFISSIIRILERAESLGFKCFIDPHQDTWSRFSGGSGAPGWSFDVAGLNFEKFNETGAAVIHDFMGNSTMVWPTNYIKLASATMFTLFYAGNIFAPDAYYEGETIQDYLQRHYCECFAHLALRLKHLNCVLGFEVMNEPHPGYIGLESIYRWNPVKDLHLGDSPSPLEAFGLGSGAALPIKTYIKSWPWPSRVGGSRIINAEKESAWLPGRECVWKQHGVWEFNDKQVPVALKPHYFASHPKTGAPVVFGEDCFVPFARMYNQHILKADPKLFLFIEPVPNEDPPFILEPIAPADNMIYAPHWYDLKVLFEKSFNSMMTHDVQSLARGTKNIFSASYFGIHGARKNYVEQIRKIVRIGNEKLKSRPIIFGECGIPMDINGKRAFATGDYAQHTQFLDMILNAMEVSQVNFTLWNYNPINNNIFGDHWNGEDFSIISLPQTPKTSTSRDQLFLEGGSAPGSKTASPDLKKEQSLASLIRTRIPHRVVSYASDVSESDRASLATEPSFVATDLSKRDVDESSKDRSPERYWACPAEEFELNESFEESVGDRNHAHNHGGRALDAVIRPYAAKIAGIPIQTKFSLSPVHYTLEFIANPCKDESTHTAGGAINLAELTEIFVPNFHFRRRDVITVQVSDGIYYFDFRKQSLYWVVDPSASPTPSPFAYDRCPDAAKVIRDYTHAHHRDPTIHWIRISVSLSTEHSFLWTMLLFLLSIRIRLLPWPSVYFSETLRVTDYTSTIAAAPTPTPQSSRSPSPPAGERAEVSKSSNVTPSRKCEFISSN